MASWYALRLSVGVEGGLMAEAADATVEEAGE